MDTNNNQSRSKLPNWDGASLHYVPDLATARSLVASKADVNALNGNGYTPLHTINSVEIAQYLIQNNANIHHRLHRTDYTILHSSQSPQLSAYLITQHRFDPNITTKDQQTPLILSPNAEMTRTLLDLKADPCWANCSGNTALHFSRDETMSSYLINAKADVNAINVYNITPLYYVRNLNMAYTLINSNASVQPSLLKSVVASRTISRAPRSESCRANDAYMAPLHYVSDPDVAALLLQFNSDPNVRDANGRMPLHSTKYNPRYNTTIRIDDDDNDDYSGNNEYDIDHDDYNIQESQRESRLIAVLLENRADPNALSGIQLRPLHEKHSLDGLKYLLDAHADPFALTRLSLTPLHVAASQTSEHIKLLLSYNVDVNAKDCSCRTPIFYAWQGSTAQTLVKAKADVSARTDNWHTPLHRARNADVVRVLAKAKCDLAAQTITGSTILHTLEDPDTLREAIRLLKSTPSRLRPPRNCSNHNDSQDNDNYSFLSSPIFSHDDPEHLYEASTRLYHHQYTLFDDIINISDKYYFYAIFRHSVPAVKLLIESHADMHCIDPNGDTFLTHGSIPPESLPYSSMLPLLCPLNTHNKSKYSLFSFISYDWKFAECSSLLFDLFQYGLIPPPPDALHDIPRKTMRANPVKDNLDDYIQGLKCRYNDNTSSSLYVDSLGSLQQLQQSTSSHVLRSTKGMKSQHTTIPYKISSKFIQYATIIALLAILYWFIFPNLNPQ